MKIILPTIAALALLATPAFAADLTTTTTTTVTPAPQQTYQYQYQYQPPPVQTQTVQVQHHHVGPGPGPGPGVEFRGPDVRFGGPGVGVQFGEPGFHGRFLGFGRHFWHGSWYDYGVGPCWALGPDGRYWWVCD